MMMAASTPMVDKRPPSSAQSDASNREQLSAEDYWLDVALQDSFPCSDPNSSMRSD
jgi:hypothetical protein